MPTSAEQLHQAKLNMEAVQGSDQRLFVDLDVCAAGECQDCDIRCSYFYHPENNGIISVVELATYALVCRRCEEPHCVDACPFGVVALHPRTGLALICDLCAGDPICVKRCATGAIAYEAPDAQARKTRERWASHVGK